jgi:hypothetical protein
LKVALTPRQLKGVLAEATEKDLKEELASRLRAKARNLCDYCAEPLNSEPPCAIPYRHEGREPERWEGICDTPRISSDRKTRHFSSDDGGHTTMSRFPCTCRGTARKGCITHDFDIRIHIECDGQGCDYEFCQNGLIKKHLDFGDDFKLKWPEDIVDWGSGMKTVKQRKARWAEEAEYDRGGR